MDDQAARALEGLLRALAHDGPDRPAPAGPGQALLGSIVDAAVTLFEAEAASIALFEADPDRLVFVVAAGAQGQGVVGLSVPPTKGIAGYAFSTGEAIALSDVTSDPRFDRATAERTGYVPRSIAAVPLVSDGDAFGVLQVLDKHGSSTFTLTDMDRLGVFAAQAATAVAASRVGRDATRLLRLALHPGDASEDASADLATRLSTATERLDREDEITFWRLVDRLALMRDLPARELELVADILVVVARRRPGSGVYRRRGR